MTPTTTTSPRRQQASRANGALSKGPITPEGKLKSSQNSLRHGMLANTIVLATESKERFDLLLASFMDEHQPITESEITLVETMVIARWKQLRIWAMETVDLDNEIAKLPRSAGPIPLRAAKAFRNLADTSRSLDLTHRYQTTCDRQFHRALRQLQDLKQHRGHDLPQQTQDPDWNQFPTPGASATWNPDQDPVQDLPIQEIEEMATEEQHNQIFPLDPSPTSEQNQPAAPAPRAATTGDLPLSHAKRRILSLWVNLSNGLMTNPAFASAVLAAAALLLAVTAAANAEIIDRIAVTAGRQVITGSQISQEFASPPDWSEPSRTRTPNRPNTTMGHSPSPTPAQLSVSLSVSSLTTNSRRKYID